MPLFILLVLQHLQILTGNVTTLGDVYVGTTKQVLNTDYTYSDGEITFTVAPANKAVIKASYV